MSETESTERLEGTWRLGGFLCALWLLWCAKIVWVIARETKSDSAILLAELLLLLFFVLAVESFLKRLPDRYPTHVVFLILCGLVAYTTAFATIMRVPVGTDELYFSAAAAEKTLHGVNPYGLDLSVGNSPPIPATLPAGLHTRFTDGSVETTLPYPALSVLLFVPVVLAKVSVVWVNFVAFIACVIVFVLISPPRYRSLAPLVFLVNPALLEYGVGGVEDIIFVLPLMIAAFAWIEMPVFAGAALGLACAIKQVPWLDVPVFIVGVLAATPPPWQKKMRVAASSAAAVALAFALPNVYFFATKPQAWFAGVMRPFTARYEEAGLGIVSFNLLHPNVIPREAMTIAAVVTFLALLFVGYRYFGAVRNGLWLLPGIALFVAPRSLENYFIYLIPICAAAWFGSLPEAEVWKKGMTQRWRRSPILRLLAI